MAKVRENETNVNITLGHVGRHCILHALPVNEATISQVCLSVCVSVSVPVYAQVDMCVCVCCILVCTCVCSCMCAIL